MTQVRVTLTFAVMLVAGIAAQPASAAVVRLDDDTYVCDEVAGCSEDIETTFGLVVVDRATDANRLVIEKLSRSRVRVTESNSTLRAGRGCRIVTPGTALCSRPGAVDRAEVLLGAGDDSVRMTGLNGDLSGGLGDDDLVGVGGYAYIAAGPGADRMGAVDGGSASIDYSARSESVVATAGTGVDDGSPGEGDEVFGRVTFIRGGAGDDVLGAAAVGTRISGGPGSDTLTGRSGNDTLTGESGGDRLSGGRGRDNAVLGLGSERGVRASFGDGPNDGEPAEGDDLAADIEVVEGTVGNDVLIGDERDNTFSGGSGRDRIYGGSGDDRFGVDDDFASDLLVPGPGRDRLTALEGDRVRAKDGEPDRIGCLRSAPASLAGDRIDNFVNCAPSVTIRGLRFTTGRFSLRFVCPALSAIRCAGQAVIRRGTRVLGRKQFGPIAPGRSQRVTIPIRTRRAGGATLTLRTIRRSPPSRTERRLQVRLH